MNSELREIQSQLNKDIQLYKEILSEALEHQLINSLIVNKSEIFDALKQVANKGGQSLTIFFVPEHIYKKTFVFEGNHAIFSLENCVDNHIYENRFFGKKQVKYTNIKFKKYYVNLCSKIDINKSNVLNEILINNPSIKSNLKNHFETLGLAISIKEHEYFLVIDLSF